MGVKLASAGSVARESMMSVARMPPSTSAWISALLAWPSLIQLMAAWVLAFSSAVYLATYSVPADKSLALSATNMNSAPLVASSPISAVRWSGMT